VAARISWPCALAAVAAVSIVGAASAAPTKSSFVLKGGQQLIFSATVADGKVTLGTPRLVKLGAETPKDGEISVGLTPKDKDFYSQVMVTEKTSAPIDFVATGHIGEIVIDEREIHGKLSEPFEQHIGGVSWTVVLHDFEVSPPAKPPEMKAPG
jgi:hypothetical protein